MKDHDIVALYWQRSERAIPETEAVYGHYCHTVAYNLLRNQEDAEESVNDTWLAAWNAMPPSRPDNLKAFLGIITRNIAVSRLRRSGSLKRGSGEAAAALEELSECLPTGNSYFWYDERGERHCYHLDESGNPIGGPGGENPIRR